MNIFFTHQTFFAYGVKVHGTTLFATTRAEAFRAGFNYVANNQPNGDTRHG